MSALGDLLYICYRFVKYMFKKLSYNGILIIVLIIAIPGTIMDCQNEKGRYRYKKVYELKQVNRINKISWNDPIVKESSIIPKKGKQYLVATIAVENKYSEPLDRVLIFAKNQDGRDIDCENIGYYNTMRENGYYTRAVIPAGVTKEMTCIMEMDEMDEKETKTITFYTTESDSVKGKEVVIPVK